jgi:antitoxin HicB
MISYPYTLTQDDNDTLLVEFPDFPEAHTFGDTADTAAAHAVDALMTAIVLYMRDRRPLPRPSAGKLIATLPALASAKVELYLAMLTRGTTKYQLAKRLEVHPPQVDRLLDLRHSTRLEALEEALRAVDRTLWVMTKPFHPVPLTAALPKRGRRITPAKRSRSR